MRRREVGRLMGAVQRQGMTLVPLSLYFNPRGWAKIELALAKGKQLHDKRAVDQGAGLAARAGAGPPREPPRGLTAPPFSVP